MDSLIPVSMGLWAFWTWSQDREQKRQKERTRLAALYVNPFLSACEDLQSRISHILELSGLRALRQRYSDGAYAAETLYLIVRYFGWETVVHCYGPYTQDPVVTRLAEAVRRAFATTDEALPVGPFNFFHPEQRALGKMVMLRLKGNTASNATPSPATSSRSAWRRPLLSDGEAVQQSLEALRSTEGGGDLQGRVWLAQAQHHLVNLLGYLEGKEGYRLFPGEWKKCSGLPRRSAPANMPRGPVPGVVPIAQASGPGRGAPPGTACDGYSSTTILIMNRLEFGCQKLLQGVQI
jgi:hypothetical protein